jgi:hypothetical protein
MASFGNASRERLDTCELDLQELFNFIVIYRDCTVIQGHRGKQEQNEAYASKNSKVQWPDSNHNKSPSRAADIMPWYDVKPHVRWPVAPEKALQRLHEGSMSQDVFLQNMSEWVELHAFANFVLGVAESRKIHVRWGGHFKSFFDGPHWEVI